MPQMGTYKSEKGSVLTHVEERFIEAIKDNELYEALENSGLTPEEFRVSLENNREFRRLYYQAIGISHRQEEFIRIFPKKLFNVTKTCSAISINRKTYYRWRKNNPVFRREIDYLKEEYFDNVESVLLHKIFVEKDTKALIFFMKSQMKDRGYGNSKVKQQENTVKECNCNKKYEGWTLEQLETEGERLRKIARLPKYNSKS